MKTKLLYIAFAIFAIVSCSKATVNDLDTAIEVIEITDEIFEKLLISQGIDSDGIVNQQILKSDAKEISTLNLSNLEHGKISNLTGIEGFTNLSKLMVTQHDIAQIDLRKNINLDTLNLSGNRLSQIDLSYNTKLIAIDLIANEMNSITGLSALHQLKELDLSWNYFETFSIASQTLEVLHLSNNNLISLNISSVPNLKNLLLTSNKLESLDINSNQKLETVLVSDNVLQTINLAENQNLTHLYITSNLLSDLDVSANQNLIDLKVDRNPNLSCIKILDDQNIPQISISAYQEVNTICN